MRRRVRPGLEVAAGGSQNTPRCGEGIKAMKAELIYVGRDNHDPSNGLEYRGFVNLRVSNGKYGDGAVTTPDHLDDDPEERLEGRLRVLETAKIDDRTNYKRVHLRFGAALVEVDRKSWPDAVRGKLGLTAQPSENTKRRGGKGKAKSEGTEDSGIVNGAGGPPRA